MAGITGLVSRDETEVDESTLSDMLAELGHRGRDGSWTTALGHVGLGQQRSHTTPEAEYDDPPLKTASCLLTADARIDNRTELYNRLDVETDSVVTDADLILAAYDQWGVDCPEYLVGAYAFAVWDSVEEWLFCARDHVGIRPFFYANTDDAFVFASEIGPLVDLELVTDRLDEVTVGLYLPGFISLPERTFYEDVRALPPAHWAVVDDDGVRIQRYWSLDGPEIELDSEEAYLEEFRDRFREAVRARLRAPENVRVGSTLSGGLDSSSICCVASTMTDRPLPTFSVVFDEIPGSDETEYIDAVHDDFDFDSHFVRGDRHSPFEHADRMLDRLGEPFVANTLYIHWAMYRAAAAEDVRVILDGYGGDQAVSRGLARFPELLVRGHPVELARELRKHGERYDSTLYWQLYDRVMKPLEPETLRRLRQRLSETADPVARRSDVIDGAFADQVGLGSHAREISSRRQRTVRAEQRRILGGGSQANGLEVANASAATFGIEPRFPFFDRRVMEFCFRTPSQLKLRDGWRRWLLRNALSETLPPKIRDRTTKGDLSVAFYETLRSRDNEELQDLFATDHFPPYLDREKVQQSWRQFLNGDESNVLANVWRPALLCRWFELSDRYD